MKKTLLIALLLGAATLAEAQIVVGGCIAYEHKTTGYGTQHMEGSTGTLTTGNLFTLSTRLGFALSDFAEIGIKPNASFSVYVYQTGAYEDDTKTWAAITELKKDMLVHSIAPYTRLRLLHTGDFSINAEFTADLNWGREGDSLEFTSEEYPLWGILLTPVASYRMGNHLSVDLYFNMLTIGYVGLPKEVRMVHAFREEEIANPTEFGISSAASKSTLLSLGFAWRI